MTRHGPSEWALFKAPYQGSTMETPRNVAYHGQCTDVLLTKQWLKKQHCTLREKGATSSRRSREAEMSVWKSAKGWGEDRKMRAEKMMGDQEGRLSSWRAHGGECVCRGWSDGWRKVKEKGWNIRISNRVQLSTEREYWENSEVRPPHFNNSNPLPGARRKRALSRGAPPLFTSAADRITLVPTNDSAYRWISWQVPVKTVRRVTTDGLSALACSARASAPAQATVKPRANTQIVRKTRAMAHPLRSQPRRTESLKGGLRTMCGKCAKWTRTGSRCSSEQVEQLVFSDSDRKSQT